MDKEVGFVSGSASTWNANDTIATVSTTWGDYLVDGYGKNICFFDGFFWRVSKHSLIRISAVDATVVETVAFIFNGHTLDSFSGPAVEIPWLVSLENGKFAFRDANTIYTVDSRTGDLAVLFGTPTGAVSTYLSNRNRTGAFYYDGWIYYTDQVGSNDVFFKRANIKTLDIEKLQSTHNNEGLHGNFDVGANITLRYTDAGVPEVWNYVGVGSPVSSILGVYIRDESTPSNGLTQMAIHPYQPLSAEVVNGSEFANHRLLRYEDGGSFGEIYLQEVGDVASRISIQLEAPIDFWNRNGSVVGRGDLVGHFIKAIARNSVPNYLDYVVSLTYNDGYSERTIDSGTQSWALRGIVDDVEVIMPSTISLEVLPDVFSV